MTERSMEDLAARILDGDDITWQDQPEHDASKDSVIVNLRLIESITKTVRRQTSADGGAALQRGLEETINRLMPQGAEQPMPDAWGNMEIRGALGSGSYATVFRAWDPALERECALKLFHSTDPEQQQALLDEGRRLARIDHPGVVRVYGAEEHDGRVGLWMELIDGPTLEDHLAQYGPMSELPAASLARELCSALAAVHGSGMVHGDVKAQNVIRRADGRWVLTDFGSGADMDKQNQHSSQGTPLYLAPERLEGQGSTASTDLYALGVLVYHVVSGSWPVQAESLDQLRQAHLSEGPVPLLDRAPNLSAGFGAAVECAIATEPGERYPSAGAFATALRMATGVDLANDDPKPRRWPRGLAVAAMVTVLVGAAMVWFGPFGEQAPGAGAATTWSLDFDLYRLQEDGTTEPLADGSSVTLGDRLVIEIAADRELYVYIINEDDQGNAFALYPTEGNHGALPLAAGQVHRLPGDSSGGLAWRIDRSAGVERIHVLASPWPMDHAQLSFESLPPARLALPKGFNARGMGTVEPAEFEGGTPARAFVQAAQSVSESAEGVEGAQYRVLELPHTER